MTNSLLSVAGLGPNLPSGGVTVPGAPASAALPAVLQAVIEQGDVAVGPHPWVGGNSVEVVKGSAQFADQVVRDIDAAQRLVNISMFGFLDGGTSDGIVAALMRAADRGVEVNVQADGFGSLQTKGAEHRRMLDRLREGMVNVRVAWPTTWGKLKLAFDHRKLVVIDGDTSYVGGMNIAKRYDSWHDALWRIQGPASAQAGIEFLGRWVDTGETASRVHRDVMLDALTRPVEHGQSGVRLLANSPFTRHEITDTFLADIAAAKQRAWIMTPSIGDGRLARALADAARRDVDVRVLIPSFATRDGDRVTRTISGSYYEDLMGAGVKVYEQPVHAHLKVHLIDDAAAMTSFNLNTRSSTWDYELGAQSTGEDALRATEQLFADDMARSRPVAMDEATTIGRRAVRLLRAGLNLRF